MAESTYRRPRASGQGSVLVTGAAGFIGSHLVRELVERGYETLGLDRRPAPSDSRAADFFQVDLRDADAVSAVMARCHPATVFHLAAQSSVVVSQREPQETIETNVTATVALAEAAAAVGTNRVVFFSTGGAMYGDPPGELVTELDPPTPHSMYGASKLAAEHLLDALARIRGLELSVLRPGNVYGPGQDAAGESGVVAIFAERMLRDEPVTIFGDGTQIRDYVYVDDVVEAAIKAASCPPSICHASSGIARSTNDIFNFVASASKYKQAPIYAAARAGEIHGAALDAKRAERAWGWRAQTDFETGIVETVNSFR